MLSDCLFSPSDRDYEFADALVDGLDRWCAAAGPAAAPAAPAPAPADGSAAPLAAPSPAAFVYSPRGGVLRRVVCSRAALTWRAGVRAWLRCEVVLSSGAVRVSSVPCCSLRAAAFRSLAAVASRGVLRASLFLSDGRWVCSAFA